MNTFGRCFRVEIYGESHGPAVGVVVDGSPPGIALSLEDLERDLARRRSGASGTTDRYEADSPEILSGLFEGHTTGSPICVVMRNADTRSSDYDAFKRVPRPGHADFTSRYKYGGFSDPRGSGHFSGRVTAGLVAAGAIAKRVLAGLALPGAAPALPSFETRLLEAAAASISRPPRTRPRPHATRSAASSRFASRGCRRASASPSSTPPSRSSRTPSSPSRPSAASSSATVSPRPACAAASTTTPSSIEAA